MLKLVSLFGMFGCIIVFLGFNGVSSIKSELGQEVRTDALWWTMAIFVPLMVIGWGLPFWGWYLTTGAFYTFLIVAGCTIMDIPVSDNKQYSTLALLAIATAVLIGIALLWWVVGLLAYLVWLEDRHNYALEQAPPQRLKPTGAQPQPAT